MSNAVKDLREHLAATLKSNATLSQRLLNDRTKHDAEAKRLEQQVADLFDQNKRLREHAADPEEVATLRAQVDCADGMRVDYQARMRALYEENKTLRADLDKRPPRSPKKTQ